MGNAAPAAFAASCAFSVSFCPPFVYYISLKIPDQPSPEPSIAHGCEYAIMYLTLYQKSPVVEYEDKFK
jgi:hypothetical protein